jgi:cytochrome c oxidase subunit II
MDQTSWKYWLPLPPDFSTQGPQIDHLIYVVHYLMAILFVGWGIFFVYCLIRFRKKAGQKAIYQPIKGKFAKYSEVAVILAEAVLLVGISMPVWAKYKEIPSESESLRIRVIGEQFAWNFHYPGKDGIFGKTDVKFVNNTGNSLGLDPTDPNGKDDIVTLNEMHVPVKKPIIMDVSSKDVIHSFSINVLRVKQDAVPGMRIPIWFEATKTGEHDIGCAQLCGLGHYRMRAFITIDTPENYAKWQAEKISMLQGGNSQ